MIIVARVEEKLGFCSKAAHVCTFITFGAPRYLPVECRGFLLLISALNSAYIIGLFLTVAKHFFPIKLPETRRRYGTALSGSCSFNPAGFDFHCVSSSSLDSRLVG